MKRARAYLYGVVGPVTITHRQCAGSLLSERIPNLAELTVLILSPADTCSSTENICIFLFVLHARPSSDVI